MTSCPHLYTLQVHQNCYVRRRGNPLSTRVFKFHLDISVTQHKLNIKIGMPVMVLWSLNPPRPMNGTRCIVTKPSRNVIKVTIAAGPFKNETHVIPRIRLQPSHFILPFTFLGLYFPLRPCFGLTINKTQGQTLQFVGLDLRTPVFSHGKVYVALSRTSRKDAIHILTEREVTSNVVYSEALGLAEDLSGKSTCHHMYS